VRFASALIGCLLLLYSMGVAHAEKRVALVIGNSAYQNAPALINPKNDAQDIGKSLRELGFSTIVATLRPRLFRGRENDGHRGHAGAAGAARYRDCRLAKCPRSAQGSFLKHFALSAKGRLWQIIRSKASQYSPRSAALISLAAICSKQST